MKMRSIWIIITLLIIGLIYWYFFTKHCHTIRTYEGILTKDENCKDPIPNFVLQFKFDNELVYAIYDSELLKLVNTKTKLAKFKDNIPANKFGNHPEINGTFISIIPSSIIGNKIPKTEVESHQLHGTKGCIPKFFADQNGDVLYINGEVMCLIAGNVPGSVNPELFFFQTGTNSYQELNEAFDDFPLIQGGIDRFSSEMKIYKDEVYLFSINQN